MSKPVVKVKARTYQPSKEEVEAPVRIPMAPEALATALLRQAHVEEEK